MSKGNTTLLDWINDEIKSQGEESFFHKDYEGDAGGYLRP